MRIIAPMRILHVLQYSLPVTMGYAIRAEGLLYASRHFGWDVAAVTGGALEGERPGREEIEEVDYFRTRPLRLKLPSGVREAWLSRRLERRIVEVAAQFSPDVIHAHSPAYNGFAALRAARRLRVPFVYEMRALWEEAAAGRRGPGARSVLFTAARALEEYVLRRADAVVCICEGLRREIYARGITGRVFVIPNGVRTERFKPSPPDPELARALGLPAGPVFGFVGSLFNYEGVEDLLDAVPAVLSRNRDVSFVIAGGGERARQVAARVGALNSRRVVYVGAVPHEDVRRYYSVIDCLVYPRRRTRLTECVTPLKPLEAMASGKAVIATDIGGHRELIQNGVTGLLYPPERPEALADVLCAVAADGGLRRRLAAAALEYALAGRDWKAAASPLVEVYRAAFGLSREPLRAAASRAS